MQVTGSFKFGFKGTHRNTVHTIKWEFSPPYQGTFYGILEAEESTGQHLASMILTRLEELEIPFEDCRGQSYDNGANMKGKIREFKPGS